MVAWLPEHRALPMRLVTAAQMHGSSASDLSSATVSASFSAAPDSLIFQSHYRSFPLLPGVYLIEAAVQALELAYADANLRWPTGIALRDLRLARAVSPGEDLILDATAVQVSSSGGVHWLCTLTHEGQRVARFTLLLGVEQNTASVSVAGPPAAADGVVLDSADILRRLPHRPPILLVDHATLAADARSLQARKAICLNELCYQRMAADATPGSLAYPLALLAESFVQSCGLLITHDRRAACDEVMILGAIAQASFHGNAFPGDCLRHEVNLNRALAGAAFISGRTWVGDRPVATYQDVMVALRPAHVLRPTSASDFASRPSTVPDTSRAPRLAFEATVVP